MVSITPYIIITLFTLFIDFIWLFLNYNNYNRLVNKVQGSSISINFIGAILSYLTVIIGLFFFSIPMIQYKLKENKNQSLFLLCLIYGGGLGLIMYGIFNTTNIGIFKNYEPFVATIDTLWGTFLFTISSYIFFLIQK
jgi:uncharacterized membrane protein